MLKRRGYAADIHQNGGISKARFEKGDAQIILDVLGSDDEGGEALGLTISRPQKGWFENREKFRVRAYEFEKLVAEVEKILNKFQITIHRF